MRVNCLRTRAILKKTWQFLNEIIGRKTAKGDHIETINLDGVQIIKWFGWNFQFFSNIGKSIAENLPPTDSNPETYLNEFSGSDFTFTDLTPSLVNGVFSEFYCSISMSVLQGSILGPIQFFLFIIDIYLILYSIYCSQMIQLV